MKGFEVVRLKDFERALKSKIVTEVRVIRNKKGIWRLFFKTNLEGNEDKIFTIEKQRGGVMEWRTTAGMFSYLSDKSLLNEQLRVIGEE